MNRKIIEPRPDWEKTVESQGFMFHSTDDTYWNEAVCYEFKKDEILAIEAATTELFEMCLAAVQHVIDQELYEEFKIPPQYAELIEYSWENDLPSLYGRFDLGYDGSEIKLLEFNADTPTSLLEASVIQWFWLQDFDKNKDQFNSIHEKLIAHLKYISPYMLSQEIHFACVRDSIEDYMTVAYIMDCAKQADYTPKLLYMDDINYHEKSNRFLGVQDDPIRDIFKLYPYEWMVKEEFGQFMIDSKEKTRWIEPAWKMILSNKMILKVLWELYPNHKYLLETDVQPLASSYVRKPILSREGANVQIVENGKVIAETDGEYGGEGYIYQQYFKIPDFEGHTPIIGSWLIGGQAAGMGIREVEGLITHNFSQFIPHYFTE
jgi:glutathionylspermidine synthase